MGQGLFLKNPVQMLFFTQWAGLAQLIMTGLRPFGSYK